MKVNPPLGPAGAVDESHQDQVATPMLGADIDVDAIAGGGDVFHPTGALRAVERQRRMGAVSIAFLKTPRIGQKRTAWPKTLRSAAEAVLETGTPAEGVAAVDADVGSSCRTVQAVAAVITSRATTARHTPRCVHRIWSVFRTPTA